MISHWCAIFRLRFLMRQVVKLLLERRASFTATDKMNRTPLMAAAVAADAIALKALLEVNAVVDTQRASLPKPNHLLNGNTALIDAATANRGSAVQALLTARASPDLANERQETALMHACDMNCIHPVRKLLEANASIDLLDRSGKTCLMWACRHGAAESVKEILMQPRAQLMLCLREKGYGFSALVYACR